VFHSPKQVLIALAAAILGAATASRALAITGAGLALRSSGASQSSSWVLDDNGYVGTYITLDAPGDVTVTVQASGQDFGGVAPHMNVAVADSMAGFDVTSGVNSYAHTFALPAGTHFIRTEFNNDPQKTARALTVANLDVTGATVFNANTNANALAAADTYVANYRRGPAKLALVGVEPGAEVHVELKRHDFRFGTAVGGTTVNGVNNFLNNANYSNFLLNHFNTITQGNAGKWAYNEATRDVVTMQAVDRIFEYAEQHELDVRLHNMLWGDSQQPGWASTLLTNAVNGNATAKADLRGEISERIDYYVGDNNPATTSDRAARYQEMDLLNEHVHKPNYWNVYGATGIADMFNEAASAVADAGSSARLYLNEYNVLQYGFDSYANWYRDDVEEIENAGGAISGIGVQYYPVNASGSNVHSAARIQQVFQNLSVTGLPISLTEFGVQTAAGTTVAQAGPFLNETMRMVFGTPGATTFMMWGFAPNDVWDQAPLAALVDANYNLTSVGLVYEQLMNQWDTDLMLPVAADGTIDFTGFYGDYDVTVDGKTYRLALDKGVADYNLVVNLAADFNNDGTVDAADLGVWQTRFDQGLADGADLLLWQQQLGMTVSMPISSASAAAVPEPSMAVLVSCAIAAVLACRIVPNDRRKRREAVGRRTLSQSQ
jgi:GH35 family endo-1,4-beta-xylanase